MAHPKANSCYARHGKVPYKYSESYERWHRATTEAGKREADIAFRRLYNIPFFRVDPDSGRATRYFA